MRPPYRNDRAEAIVSELLKVVSEYQKTKERQRATSASSSAVDQNAGPSKMSLATTWMRKKAGIVDSETKDKNVGDLKILLETLLREIQSAKRGYVEIEVDDDNNDNVPESKEFLERAEELSEFKTGSPTLDGTGENGLRATFMTADRDFLEVLDEEDQHLEDGGDDRPDSGP